MTAARPVKRLRWEGPPRRVLVSGGGGRDAFALLDTVLSGFETLASHRRPELTLVAGPLMDAELAEALRHRADAMAAIFRDTTPDLPDLLARSDLFITMGGYNSIAETLVTACPAVVVPRVGPSGEQRIRAERLQALGLATVVWRDDLTPARMAQVMTARPGRPPAMPGLAFDGATVAADHIAAILTDAAHPSAKVTMNV